MEANINPITVFTVIFAAIWAVMAFFAYKDMTKRIMESPMPTEEKKHVKRFRWLVALCWPIVLILKAN